MSRAALALVCAVGFGLAGCGEATPPDADRDPRPAVADGLVADGALVSGQGLIDDLDRLQLREHPTSVVPAELLPRLRELLSTEAFVIEPDAWVAGQVLPAGSPIARLVDQKRPLQRWRATLPVAPDLGLGGFWMTHQGKPLRQAAAGEPLWYLAGHVFAYDAERHVMVHYGADAAGPVAFGWRPGVGSSLQTWDATLAERQAPTRSAELVQRVRVGSRDRRALLAPAPTVLERQVDALHGDALEVGVAVLDLALTLENGQLRRAEGGSDGVTFAVELRDARDAIHRVWSQHVAPGGAWLDAHVDLSAWRGQDVTLRLLTEPGADAAFDLACWSTLRLRGGARTPPARPHVVLIDIDTLRADRLGCYGATRGASPQLDAWAAENATVFRDMVSAADWTLPSTASMLTGLSVSQHEVILGDVRITEGMRPLALRLADAGYETWARTDGGMVGAAFGFATGFDEYDGRGIGHIDAWGDPFAGLLERLAARDAERPVFLFVQSYAVHGPYAVDTRYADPTYDGPLAGHPVTTDEVSYLAKRGELTDADWAYVNALYDAGIARFDAALGPFLRGLDEALGGAPTLVMVTSDHGEELGDRGGCGHGHSLHDELTRVPLLVSWPDGAPAARDDTPASHLDLVPTVLAAAGLDVDDDLSGRSLRDAPRRPHVRVAQHRDTARSVWFDGWKWIEGELGGSQTKVRALYATDDDPGERHDLRDERADIAARLSDRLQAWRAEHGPRDLVGVAAGNLDAELVDQLAALGYVEDAK